ncbi:hypothetical protein AV921_0207660 [Helicobacter pylori]|nr:hypothetical protein AV921_0207660 [Helicobacter pylori]OJZ97129.1 hypothetical protein AV924_0207665 [Helicobacter pylori]
MHSSIHPFIHSTIQPFNHSTIQPFNHSTIQPFNHSTIQPFNHSTIQPFNHSIKQRYPVIITFTKTHLKIPYFLLFPLSLTLSLTHATFFNHLIQ